MPRLITAVPKYRKHRGTGQALVVLNGREHYLGRYGSPASRAEYNRLTGEWLAAQRAPLPTVEMRGGNTVVEVIVAFLKFARTHYRKNGEITSEYSSIVHALKFVRPNYGRTLAAQFGPLALTAVRDKMIAAGLARTLINQHAGRIRRMFRWAASREMVDASAFFALKTVAGLEAERSDARETEPVEPVADEVVEATLPHLPTTVATMVQLQRLLGCRPAEICILRPMDLDRLGDIWRFKPESHKCQHRKGRAATRTIFIGPRAQQTLSPYLFRDPADYCFAPVDSERQRRAAASAARTVSLSCGTKSGDRKTRKRKRPAGKRYTPSSYRRAIARACDLAFPAPSPLGRRDGETMKAWAARLNEKQRLALKAWQAEHRWSPNQLRHAAGTEAEDLFGVEAASARLGHTKLNTTKIYTAKAEALALSVAAKLG